MKTKYATAALLLAAAAAAASADDDSKILKAGDKAGLTAAIGNKATVEGTVEKAEWSKSGKVMNVTFAGSDSFVLAVFQKNKDKLDAAFNGDLAKTLSGATVRVNGKLAKYGGHDDAYADAAQMIVSMPDQLTVLVPATQPATKPAG